MKLGEAIQEYKLTVKEYQEGNGIEPPYNSIDLAKLVVANALLECLGIQTRVIHLQR